MKVTVNVPFYKVIVLSVGIFETVITDEKHFADHDSAAAYVDTLSKGLVGVVVEI
jgi:hypothetical protein